MTRAMWEEMWGHTKNIEIILRESTLKNPHYGLIQGEIKEIKRLIQSEIGQME